MMKQRQGAQPREYVLTTRITFDTLDTLKREAKQVNKPLSQYVNDKLTGQL
jgi:hypothetical protein